MFSARRQLSRATLLHGALVLLSCVGAQAQAAGGAAEPAPLPERLSDTGLYEPDSLRVRAENLSYAPQYPLWSDGATKRRWIHLPPGTAIDGSNPDAWEFPPGTRLWKEFGHGRPVETRYLERLADGSWRYASYVWNADGSDAVLAPQQGVAALPVAGAPDGKYPIPSRDDCRACHEGGSVPVLSVSALQLATDRDPNALHAESKRAEHVDISDLVQRGLLRLPGTAAGEPVPALRAASPIARTALGYLHANCGHCHNAAGPLSDIGLLLAQTTAAGSAEVRVLQSALGQRADSDVNGLDMRIVAGRPEVSQLLARMKTRNPNHQMPPLGTRVADGEAVAVVERWIEQLQTREGDSL